MMIGRLPLTAHLSALSVGVANYLVIASVTVLVQAPGKFGFGASIVVAGLLLVPFSALSVLGGRVTGALVRRAGGARWVLPLGSVVQCAALAALGLLHGSLWQLGLVTGLAGLGAGIAFAGLPGVIVSAVPPTETGSALGVNQVLRYAGFATGSALTATLLAGATAPGAAWPGSGGYTTIAALGVGLCLSTALVTWLLPRRTRAAALQAG
jgi:MFS family permease